MTVGGEAVSELAELEGKRVPSTEQEKVSRKLRRQSQHLDVVAQGEELAGKSTVLGRRCLTGSPSTEFAMSEESTMCVAQVKVS